MTLSLGQLAGECPGGWFFRDLWLCHLGFHMGELDGSRRENLNVYK